MKRLSVEEKQARKKAYMAEWHLRNRHRRLKGCQRCGEPKVPGRGNTFCDPCKEVRREERKTTTRAQAKRQRKKTFEELREHRRVHYANSRARQKNVEASLTVEEWLAIVEEYNHRCAYCFGPFEQLDHVRPLHMGGITSADNVVPCCATCNMRKASGPKHLRGKSNWVPSIASRFWPTLAEELYA